MNRTTAGRGAGRLPSHHRRPRRRGRRLLTGLLATAIVLVGGLVVWRQAGGGSTAGCPAIGPVAAKQLGRLELFQRWLEHNRAAGLVGEVGWPGTAAWGAVAAKWYGAADRDGLWVTAWSAAQGWPADYSLAVYRLGGDTGTSRPGPQAAVVQAHSRVASALRGVAAPSGAFATADDGGAPYGNQRPGRYGTDYYYPTSHDYRYLAKHGDRVVRVAFTWERIQRRPDGPLDRAEVNRLKTTIYDASAAGVSVLLDLHSFGGYWSGGGTVPARRLALGTAALPTTALADLWRKLASTLQGRAGLLGYGLMNEPRQLAPAETAGAVIWQRASQQAVTAIRSTGDRHVIAVEAYGGSGPEQFVRLHPRAWIDDPIGPLRYEMHQYFDGDGSGHYRVPFTAEQRAATAALDNRSGTTHPSCATARPGDRIGVRDVTD